MGLFNKDLVAGIEQRGHGQMIGHGGAGSGHHAIRIDAAFSRDGPLQRLVAIVLSPLISNWSMVTGSSCKGNDATPLVARLNFARPWVFAHSM